MYGIYANIKGVYWWQMLPYIAYIDPMGYVNMVIYLLKMVIFHGYVQLREETCPVLEGLRTS